MGGIKYFLEKAGRKFQPYSEYKDSGAEWLGEIPLHWDKYPIRRRLFKEAGSIKIGPFGSQLKLEFMTNEGFKVYGQEHVIAHDFARGIKYVDKEKFEELAACEIVANDIVVTMMGSSGRCAVVPQGIERGIMDSHLLRIRLKSRELDSNFLCLLIDQSSYVRDQIEVAGKGAIMHGLNSSIIKSVLLAVPPPEEQQQILDFLDRETAKIDELIAKKERLIELLQEKRTALITQAVTKGLDPNVPMKDSGVEWLGKIPVHWELKRLKHIGIALIGLTFEPEDVVDSDEGILVLRASNIFDGRIVLDDIVSVKCSIPDHLVTRVGDILICARSGSRSLIGKCAKIDKASAGHTFGTFMIVFRSSSNDYLFYAFNSTLFNYQSGAFLTSTINQLTLSNLNSFKVPVPPDPEQEAIAIFLERETSRIDELITKIHEAVERLQEYHTALVSAAVTGKIDVRDLF
jgi:type I restriction enzyme S subunit